MTPRQAICKGICLSGKFETGNGTCAFICMDQLGDDARRDCQYRDEVHAQLADAIITQLVRMQTTASPPRDHHYDEEWHTTGNPVPYKPADGQW
jgi:hypothetical protein